MKTKINDGGPAFPVPGDQDNPSGWGASLRDYFAAHAPVGLDDIDPYTMTTGGDRRPLSVPELCERVATLRFQYADAMLKARSASAPDSTKEGKPTDSEMLDWLEANKPILWSLSQEAQGDYWIVTDYPGYTEEKCIEAKSARLAIDAAMSTKEGKA